MRPLAAALACLLAATTAVAAAEPVDHCATLLGSLAVELRVARALPPGRRSSFFCAKRYTSLIGASRERVLRALGPPDATGAEGDWSYFFASRHSERAAGTAQLTFRFDERGVAAVDCGRTAA